MYKTIKEIIEDATDFDKLKILPFCHITKYADFQNMTIDRKMNGNNCPVLDHDAIFFFYGKPRYIAQSEVANVMGGQPPVCLLYNYTQFTYGTKFVAFPFDSGGYKLYGLDSSLKAEKFIFFNGVSGLDLALQKFIKTFYGNNQNYVRGIINFSTQNNNDLHESVLAFENLHDTKSAWKKDYGEQAITTEIQIIAKDITFNPNIIFVPDSRYSTDDSLRELEIKIEKELEIKIQAKNYVVNHFNCVHNYHILFSKVTQYVHDEY